MNAHVRDCLVSGHEELIEAITLPDPDDRHVLAAAIPPETLRKYGIEAHHPDEFVADLLDLYPGTVCAAVNRQRASLKNPPKSVDEFLETLARHSLALTVARLRSFADLI